MIFLSISDGWHGDALVSTCISQREGSWREPAGKLMSSCLGLRVLSVPALVSHHNPKTMVLSSMFFCYPSSAVLCHCLEFPLQLFLLVHIQTAVCETRTTCKGKVLAH